MITQQHGGNVWVTSTSQGAMFSFVLPFHRSEPRSDKKVMTLAEVV
jgi:signal transduction histidine kinase